MSKYQIGDIITNGSHHYLVENVRLDNYEKVRYHLLILENNNRITSYATIIDINQYITKVA